MLRKKENKINKPLTSKRLFLVFFKVGILVLGGGPIILVAFKNEVVTKRQWLSSEAFDEKLPLVQSLPGPFGLNGAFMLGYLLLGKKGGALGILGIFMPSFLIVAILQMFLNLSEGLPVGVEKFLWGVNLAASSLVFLMAFDLLRGFIKKLPLVIAFIVTLIGVFIFKVNPVVFIFLGILFGVLFSIKRGDPK